MSTTYYCPFVREFFFGCGEDLYRIRNNKAEHLFWCGDMNTITYKQQGDKTGDKNCDKPYIVGISSNSVGQLCVISNNKLVEVIEADSGKLFSSTKAVKRPTGVQITSEEVVVSDKSGDVYQYSLDLSKRKYLLGCVSVIQEVTLYADNKFLITCDRDEKIRISHYPNCYNIHKYLLSHTEFVTSVRPMSHNRIVSIGGDNRLLYWDVEKEVVLKEMSVEGRGLSYQSPYLIVWTLNHSLIVITESEDKSTIDIVAEEKFEDNILSVSQSADTIVVFTSQPQVLTYVFSEGVLGEIFCVEGADLTNMVKVTEPVPKKPMEKSFQEYYDRKRKRLEEERLKAEAKAS